MGQQADFEISTDEAHLKGMMESLRGLPNKIGEKALKKVLRNYSILVAERAAKIFGQSAGNYETGRLRRSIRGRVWARYKGIFFKATAGVPAGKKRDDPKGAFYARFVERGHRLFAGGKDTGKVIPGVNFLEKALEQSSQEIVNDIAAQTAAELEKQMSKWGKKSSLYKMANS